MPEAATKTRARRARQRAGRAQIAEYIHSLSARHGAPARRATTPALAGYGSTRPRRIA